MTRDGRTVDLSAALQSAVDAARRGDSQALEGELAKLRGLPSGSVEGIGIKLRAMARSVRSHPSFANPAAAAQAG
jgi:hypothetical protein